MKLLNFGLGDFLMMSLIAFCVIMTELSCRWSTEGEWEDPIFVYAKYYTKTSPTLKYFVLDPAGAWLPVSVFGYFMAPVIKESNSRKVLYISLGNWALFLFFRIFWFLNIFDFGNLRTKGFEDDYSVYAFFALCKYPPGLTYLLWTIGWILMFLYLFQIFGPKIEKTIVGEVLQIYGRTSLFFYVFHLCFLDLIALPFPQGASKPQWIPLLWIVVMIFIYPFCKKYNEFKSGKDANSLWRLF